MPALAAVLGEDRLPLARQRDLVEQLVRGLGRELVVEEVEAGRLGRVEGPARVGLELHRVGAGLGRDVDQLAGDAEVAVVVGAGLGDHVAGVARTDRRDRSP